MQLTTAVKKWFNSFPSHCHPMKSIFYPIWDIILATVFFPLHTFLFSFVLSAMTITCKRISHCQLMKKKTAKNNVKHSANYYNYFIFNLCMSLYFAETMLVAVAACNFRSVFFFTRSARARASSQFSNFIE